MRRQLKRHYTSLFRAAAIDRKSQAHAPRLACKKGQAPSWKSQAEIPSTLRLFFS